MAKLRSVRVAITFRKIKSQKSPSPRITKSDPESSIVNQSVLTKQTQPWQLCQHTEWCVSRRQVLSWRCSRLGSHSCQDYAWSRNTPISEGSLTPSFTGFEPLLLWLFSGFHQPAWLSRARGSVLCPCRSCPGPSMRSRPHFVFDSCIFWLKSWFKIMQSKAKFFGIQWPICTADISVGRT